MKARILFVCIHNSARSQMAEAFVNACCSQHFEAYSAGIEPGVLNQTVVAAMKEKGIDISGNKTKSVSDMLKSEMTFEYVITVCDEASAERCPFFPGQVKRLHWGFPDPSALKGTAAQKLDETRKVRDSIESQVKSWCQQIC